MDMQHRPAFTALAEICLLFLPGIPGLLWVWPNVPDQYDRIVTVLIYVYLLAGTVYIGRQWTPNQVGLNGRGVLLSLACGAAMLGLLVAGRLAIHLPWSPAPLSVERLVWDVVFYVGLVGVTEELLFRGVLYRSLWELGGDRLAIWVSAVGFGIYHAGTQGLAGAFGTGVLGLMFAMIRWRAGGILGLVIVHGVYDIVAVEGWPGLTTEQILPLSKIDSRLALVGDVLLFGTLLYLWKVHPLVLKLRYHTAG